MDGTVILGASIHPRTRYEKGPDPAARVYAASSCSRRGRARVMKHQVRKRFSSAFLPGWPTCIDAPPNTSYPQKLLRSARPSLAKASPGAAFCVWAVLAVTAPEAAAFPASDQVQPDPARQNVRCVAVFWRRPIQGREHLRQCDPVDGTLGAKDHVNMLIGTSP